MEGSAPPGASYEGPPAAEQAMEAGLQVDTDHGGTPAAGPSPAPGEGKARKAPPEQRRRCMSDKFMLYTYKIKLCKRQDPHNWRLCPYAHPGEAGRRRPPHTYQSVMCDFSKTRKECSHGDKCPLARNALEYWLHPDKYRTIMCGHGEACTRNICFFAHTPSELRTPSSTSADDPFTAELAAATGTFQQLAISPHLAGGIGGSSSSQLVYAEPGAACPLVPSGAGSSRTAAAASALQVSQALQAVQVMGITGEQHQLLMPTPVAAGDSQLQPMMVPAAGAQRYQQQSNTLVPAAPAMIALGQPGVAAPQQTPQQSGHAITWGYEQQQQLHQQPAQQPQQMMLSAAGLPSAIAVQAQVDAATGGSVVAPVAGMGPAAMPQQQVMAGPGVQYYSMPATGYPMLYGQAVAQQQYPQPQYVQQPYQQQQQAYYPQQGAMLLMPQVSQAAGPGSAPPARYVSTGVEAVDPPVLGMFQQSAGAGQLPGSAGAVMHMYALPPATQLSEQQVQQLGGGGATPPISAAEQHYLVPNW